MHNCAYARGLISDKEVALNFDRRFLLVFAMNRSKRVGINDQGSDCSKSLAQPTGHPTAVCPFKSSVLVLSSLSVVCLFAKPASVSTAVDVLGPNSQPYAHTTMFQRHV